MSIVKYFSTLFIILFLLGSCSQPASSSKDENPYVSNTAENLEDYPVRVLYFHTTNRCPTCLTIEKLVKETVMMEYAEQVENSQLKLYVLNVDSSENQKIAEEFFAFGSAVFVSSGQGDNKQNTDITNEGFLYAQTDPDRFLEALRSAINKHLE